MAMESCRCRNADAVRMSAKNAKTVLKRLTGPKKTGSAANMLIAIPEDLAVNVRNGLLKEIGRTVEKMPYVLNVDLAVNVWTGSLVEIVRTVEKMLTADCVEKVLYVVNVDLAVNVRNRSLVEIVRTVEKMLNAENMLSATSEDLVVNVQSVDPAVNEDPVVNVIERDDRDRSCTIIS
ncbi:hypothetical protein P4C99_09195 [Pontiellaceae bacterium B1224]|nr:hypothetical protein [Pontiellaceae bacterium B1224]